jgi:hypothetical protein
MSHLKTTLSLKQQQQQQRHQQQKQQQHEQQNVINKQLQHLELQKQ